jgi:hypothetical protein
MKEGKNGSSFFMRIFAPFSAHCHLTATPERLSSHFRGSLNGGTIDFMRM